METELTFDLSGSWRSGAASQPRHGNATHCCTMTSPHLDKNIINDYTFNLSLKNLLLLNKINGGENFTNSAKEMNLYNIYTYMYVTLQYDDTAPHMFTFTTLRNNSIILLYNNVNVHRPQFRSSTIVCALSADMAISALPGRSCCRWCVCSAAASTVAVVCPLSPSWLSREYAMLTVVSITSS